VLREYLVVATRPAAANGLGLSLTDALANVEQFEQVVELLPETLKTWDGLRSVLSRSPVTGVRLHDANIAACALAHGVDAILTANPADFTGLPVTILTLSSLAS
jgi:predicted nucleic acid-binding protein